MYNLASNGALTTLAPYHLCPTRAVDGEVQKGATCQTCVHSASQHSVLIQPTSPWARVDIFKQDPNDWRCQNMWYGCKKLRQLCISSTQYDACTAYVKTSFQLNGTQSRGEDIRLNRYSQTSGKYVRLFLDNHTNSKSATRSHLFPLTRIEHRYMQVHARPKALLVSWAKLWRHCNTATNTNMNLRTASQFRHGARGFNIPYLGRTVHHAVQPSQQFPMATARTPKLCRNFIS